jgi:hypothetical protein
MRIYNAIFLSRINKILLLKIKVIFVICNLDSTGALKIQSPSIMCTHNKNNKLMCYSYLLSHNCILDSYLCRYFLFHCWSLYSDSPCIPTNTCYSQFLQNGLLYIKYSEAEYLSYMV